MHLRMTGVGPFADFGPRDEQVRFTPERRTLTDAVHLSQAPRGAATLLAAEEL